MPNTQNHVQDKLSKSVLITGALGALGSHVVTRFLKAEYSVTAVLHPVEMGSEAFEKGRNPAVRYLEADLAKPSAVRAMMNDQSFGNLIHCAGGFRYSSLDELSDADFDFLLDANLKSTFYLLRAVLPAMKQRRFGRIVLVSAQATLQPAAGLAGYLATKAGLNMIVGALSSELKDFGVNVNAVLPSIIDTPANRKAMPKEDFKKWVSPQSLADIMFSLTQPESDPIRGALLPVVGGM